jgi:hypothetical protein
LRGRGHRQREESRGRMVRPRFTPDPPTRFRRFAGCDWRGVACRTSTC